MKSTSLKIKMVLYLAPVFLIMASVANYAAVRYYSLQFKEMLKAEQYQLVFRVAAEIDDKLTHAQDSLVTQAKAVPHSVLQDPEAAERYLALHPGLTMTFDNNLLLFDSKGRIVAETAHKPSRTGMDLSYRDYIVQTLRTGHPFISPPFASTLGHAHPVVMFTAPIRDRSGTIVAILAGSIDLLRNNFLGRLAQAKIGKNGYFYLFSTDRTIVLHPDTQRIMQRDVPIGKNRLFDRVITGFEGAEETTNSRGKEFLSAFKHLTAVNWILAANYPIAEVYAPVRRAQQMGWWIVLLGGVFGIVLVAFVTGRIIQPLLDLKTQVVESRRQESAGPIAVGTKDEISDLAVEFNALIEELRIREEKRKNSSELFQLIADTSESWVFWKTPAGEDLYVSPGAQRITGYSLAELTAMPDGFLGLLHPDDRSVWRAHLELASCGVSEPLELRLKTRFQGERWIRHVCRPVRNDQGVVIGIRGSNTDITEQKLSKQQLEFVSVHDALTGLYNRVYFDAEMKRLARGRRFPVGVVVADLDNLKRINDTHGHARGDEMIRKAANLLGLAFRGEDSVCRIGGDEFAALLPGAGEEAVAAAIARVKSLLAETEASGPTSLGISLGGACAQTPEELAEALTRADAMMYKDKEIRKETAHLWKDQGNKEVAPQGTDIY